MSLPSRGAWIEIGQGCRAFESLGRRSPRGERGLKFDTGEQLRPVRRRSPHGERGLKSPNSVIIVDEVGSRSPHGERGLKLDALYHAILHQGRSPHGERGLKSTSVALNVWM